MRIVMGAAAAVLTMSVAAPALAAHATTTNCANGTTKTTSRNGLKFEARYCKDSKAKQPPTTTPPGSKQPALPVVDRPSDGGSGSPSKRMVSREEWLGLLENCRRGPNRDSLSPACNAALPGIAPEPGAAGPPAAPAVTLAMVRQSAIDQITMGAPDIGASPCLANAAACRGTVGVPVWLWVGDGGGSLPSESATATAGPYSITATAKVSQVKWSLGDGQSTVCQGTGTKYDRDVHGWTTPHCGFEHGWKDAGSYTLTASYVWDISWSGDQSGGETQTLSSTQQVTVGELQAVATSTG